MKLWRLLPLKFIKNQWVFDVFQEFSFFEKDNKLTSKTCANCLCSRRYGVEPLEILVFFDECFTYWKSDCSRLHAISPSNFQCVKHSQNKILFFKKSYAISMRNLDLGGNLFAFANRFRDPRHAQMLLAVANSFRNHFLQTPESW